MFGFGKKKKSGDVHGIPDQYEEPKWGEENSALPENATQEDLAKAAKGPNALDKIADFFGGGNRWEKEVAKLEAEDRFEAMAEEEGRKQLEKIKGVMRDQMIVDLKELVQHVNAGVDEANHELENVLMEIAERSDLNIDEAEVDAILSELTVEAAALESGLNEAIAEVMDGSEHEDYESPIADEEDVESYDVDEEGDVGDASAEEESDALEVDEEGSIEDHATPEADEEDGELAEDEVESFDIDVEDGSEETAEQEVDELSEQLMNAVEAATTTAEVLAVFDEYDHFFDEEGGEVTVEALAAAIAAAEASDEADSAIRFAGVTTAFGVRDRVQAILSGESTPEATVEGIDPAKAFEVDGWVKPIQRRQVQAVVTATDWNQYKQLFNQVLSEERVSLQTEDVPETRRKNVMAKTRRRYMKTRGGVSGSSETSQDAGGLRGPEQDTEDLDDETSPEVSASASGEVEPESEVDGVDASSDDLFELADDEEENEDAEDAEEAANEPEPAGETTGTAEDPSENPQTSLEAAGDEDDLFGGAETGEAQDSKKVES